MLAVLKDVDGKTVATAAEVVSTIEIFVLNIDAFNSWRAGTGNITDSRLVSAMFAQAQKSRIGCISKLCENLLSTANVNAIIHNSSAYRLDICSNSHKT